MLFAIFVFPLGVAVQDDPFNPAHFRSELYLRAHPLRSGDDDVAKEAPKAAHAQVLVVVSDHGSGTSSLGNALETHPCVFNVGEGFGRGDGYAIWSQSEVAECEQLPGAIFDADSGKLVTTANGKMRLKIEDVIRRFGSRDAGKPDWDSLYHGLENNVAEYFVRVRDLVCKTIPANVCPPTDCAVVLKWFPTYIMADTDPVYTKEDFSHPDACTRAKNEKAFPAWKDALETFARNPKVATLQLGREELSRQFSNFHRFDPAGTEFDCSIPRPPCPFASYAAGHTDVQWDSAACWRNPDGCLGDALKLIGLSEPKGGAGTQLMESEIKARKEQGKIASKSCSTDPLGTFKVVQNNDVQLTSTGGGHEKAQEPGDIFNAFDPRFEKDMQFSNILQAQPSPEPDPEPRWMPMKEYSSVTPQLSAADTPFKYL
jgi:hypothetical protein